MLGTKVRKKCLGGTRKTVVDTRRSSRPLALAACTRPCTGWRQVQRATVSRGCLIMYMYLPRSEGHLSGCDTARRCLTAWLAAANGSAAVRCRPPRERETSSKAGIFWPWLAGRRIPGSVIRRHATKTCCLPGRYLRGLATRSCDSCTTRRLRIRAPTKRWWPSGFSTERPATVGLGGLLGTTRGVSSPAIAHPQRQHSREVPRYR